jgi:hypothetical protein
MAGFMAKSKVNEVTMNTNPCLVCFRDTKYACILCCLPVCNCCSTAEKDENTPGWKEGKKVGYCSNCVKNGKTVRSVKSSNFEIGEMDKEITYNKPRKKYKW